MIRLAVTALVVALSQAPAMSHAQSIEMGTEQAQEFDWEIISPARYQLRGHDIIVLPEGGKYAVYKDGKKDMAYASLSDARMRGEFLAVVNPTMKEKKPMMKEKAMPMKEKPMPKTKMEKDMGQ